VDLPGNEVVDEGEVELPVIIVLSVDDGGVTV
jgi:hypothetical protein